MFSSIFGKRRSSPVEDDTPPIPGASDFVVVGPPPGSSIYPNVSGVSPPSLPYPHRPAPIAPVPKMSTTDQTFHYLQGVPFTLSRELKMASSKDAFEKEIADLLAFLTSKVQVSNYDYDFAVEKSVLKEC